jgi:hypothetical protein
VIAVGPGDAVEVVVGVELVDVDFAVGDEAAAAVVDAEGGDAGLGGGDVLRLPGEVAVAPRRAAVVDVGGDDDQVLPGSPSPERYSTGPAG